MMTDYPFDVTDWLKLIQQHDDRKVADTMVAMLVTHEPARWQRHQMLNLITAVRLDQMAKELA